MIISIAFGIILAILLWPIVCWLIGFSFGVVLEVIASLGGTVKAVTPQPFSLGKFILIGMPKTVLIGLGAMFSFYGVFVSIWYVASLVTPDSTQQMTATFLGTFGFFITAAILWGKHQDKKTDKEDPNERQTSR